MNYKILENETASVEIEFNDVSGRKEKLLSDFRKCQNGSCDCPTDQYEELESLQILSEDDSIRLQLHPKKGKCFNINEIENCVRYTLANLE